MYRRPDDQEGVADQDMDEDHLKNLVLAHNSQLPKHPRGGLEPDPLAGVLTPEKLSINLKEFLNICARKTGMERILAIRRRLAGINYSKKTITVEFLLGGTPDSTTQDFARPPDGKSRLNQRPTLAAPRATPPLDSFARTSESSLFQSDRTSKGAVRELRTTPNGQFVTTCNGSPGRTRTSNPSVTSAPEFPQGLDYLISDPDKTPG